MYIKNKPAAAFYKLFVGGFSLILEWFLLSQYGTAALRLFPTWVLFIAATYFLSSSLIIAFSTHKYNGKNFCPPLEGSLIMALALMGFLALASAQYGFYLPELPAWLVWSFSFVLPILVLLDWLLFVKKGRWRIMMPFYGLALPVCYAATMIFTAEMLPSTTDLLYPLEILNLREFGLYPALQYLAIGAVVFLIFGYILYIVDFSMSGKLSKHIVLPHIRVIDVDENGEEIVSTPSDETPSQDSVKISAASAAPVDHQPKESPQAAPVEIVKIVTEPDAKAQKTTVQVKAPKSSQKISTKNDSTDKKKPSDNPQKSTNSAKPQKPQSSAKPHSSKPQSKAHK